MTDALSDLMANSSLFFPVLNPEIDEEYATLYSLLGITDADIDIIAGTLDIIHRMHNHTEKENHNQCNQKIQYGCRLCGKTYISTDGVRKHWRTKHSNVILRRGHVTDYSFVIHSIGT